MFTTRSSTIGRPLDVNSGIRVCVVITEKVVGKRSEMSSA